MKNLDFESLMDNAAGACQSRVLMDDAMVREAIKLNIYDRLIEALAPSQGTQSAPAGDAALECLLEYLDACAHSEPEPMNAVKTGLEMAIARIREQAAGIERLQKTSYHDARDLDAMGKERDALRTLLQSRPQPKPTQFKCSDTDFLDLDDYLVWNHRVKEMLK